jgi:hypothetical protein
LRIEDFSERLRTSILVGDGAMGSLLYEDGQRCVEELNSSHPEEVFRAHQAYMEAGAQLIETNTFGANRHKLSELGIANRVAEFNHRGVKLAREAREAAKHEVLIAGSMGPLGIALQMREMPEEQIFAIFKEQAGALEERGVDLFLLETFSDVEELRIALDAIRSFSRLPIVAELTYSEEGTTIGALAPRKRGKRSRAKTSRPWARIARSGRSFCFRFFASWPEAHRFRSPRCLTRDFPSALATAQYIHVLRLSISRFSRRRLPIWGRVSSADAAAPRPSTFGRSRKR